MNTQCASKTRTYLFGFLIAMWVSQIQRLRFWSMFSTCQFQTLWCSGNINRWNWWWDHIWNINYLILCQMKYCGSQDSFLSKRKKFPKEEERGHVNYYIIILVYLLLHLVFSFVTHASNYLFKSYLNPGSPNWVSAWKSGLFSLLCIQAICKMTVWTLL